MNRCKWVNLKNEKYVKYHDEEWGIPSHDDSYLYEMLLLESHQAGLSWECILNKREDFRKAYDNFSVEMIAKYDSKKIEELLQNKKIIRNRLKIKATIKNAQIFQKIQKEYSSFSNYIWSYTKNKVVKRMDDTNRTTSPLSDEISSNLYKRGMRFVGSTIIYSYLQAIGIINDHERTCDCYRK